jgi:MFS family permease
MKFEDRPGYKWVMVAVAFSLGVFSFGALGSVGVFLKPLAAEFGWSRGGLSFGYTALTLATALSAIFWGMIADRYGTRWMTLFGAAAMGVAMFLLSTTHSLAEYYLYYFLFGALGHGAITGPLMANVSLWFTRNIGLAIGLGVAGGAIGQGLVPFIARALIDNYGWQSAYAALGLGYLCIALPIALLVRDSPRRHAAHASEPPRMRDGSVFPLPPMIVVAWIASAVVFCCITMSVPIVHVVPLLTDKGMAREEAVTVLFILMIAGAFGRVFGGQLADRIGALPAYATMSLGQTLCVFLFPHVDNIVAIYALGIAFGIFFSGDMAAFLVCVRMMVPTRFMARAMAVVSMFGWIGMGIGGWEGGAVFDLTGNYAWSFAIGSIAGVVNLTILSMFYLNIQRGLRRQVMVPAVG